MPKVKTKSGAKKRFKLTGTGKVKRKNAFKNHVKSFQKSRQMVFKNRVKWLSKTASNGF